MSRSPVDGVRQAIERVYVRTPISVPRAASNAYLRWALDDEFDAYDHPPDPFAVRWIDPDRIESFTGRPYPPYHDRKSLLGTVRGGDWDRRNDPPIVDDEYRKRYELYRADRFSESVFFESMRAHFEDDVDWADTPFVERCLALAEQDKQSWRSLSSPGKILDRCATIDDLYEAIRTDGYRSQRALGERSLLAVTEEIVVDLGRDGTPLFVNGRHRLAIAKLLDLDRVPVGVLVRHERWMATRESYARCDGPVPDHPDLVDVPGQTRTLGRNGRRAERRTSRIQRP